MREIIEAIGEDPQREGLRDTPRRVAEMYDEVFCGLSQAPEEELRVGFEEGHHEMVLVKGLSLYSMCEHHLLPFYGTAHIAYIPRGRVIGASKLARLLDIFARRPQIQERLANQIVDTLMKEVQPQGAAVVLEAEHFCMTIRGVRRPGSKIVTSALRGVFRERPSTRAEFFSLISNPNA